MNAKKLLRMRRVLPFILGKDPWLEEVLSNRIPSTSISLESAILKLRGKEIWRRLVPLDWAIHCDALWLTEAMVIGGYLGESSGKLISKVSKLKSLHIYEPIPNFFNELQHKFQDSPKVSIRNIAISGVSGGLVMDLCGDSTLARHTGRSTPGHLETIELVVQSITLGEALKDVNDVSETSILMNCEGSEYEILESIKAMGKKPYSLFFQTHTTGEDSYEKLYRTRSELARYYIPIVCEDWAWDIWLRKDASPLSAIEIERFKYS